MKMNENRASQLESMLKNLPEAVEQGLSGLTAGPALKARIQLAAAEQKKPRTRTSPMKLVRGISLACCCALLALGVFHVTRTTPAMPDEEQSLQPASLISSGTLGDDSATQAPPISSDLGNSGLHIRSGHKNTDSMWAPTSGGYFPMVGVNGRYYRMLTTPRNADSRLLGSAIGTVKEFTTEPSLSGTDTVLSNAASLGETIYAVKGMDNTLVAARVDGQMRLFQRVSFNGNALRGREKLADTLQVEDHVIAMELTGVGTITDPAVCSRLLDTLFDCASYDGSGSLSSRQYLILELDNNLIVQLAVKNDRVAACGVWSCPEFFEEFVAHCD